jgi:DNA-directed RNA polymerase specialized sigma24 family protein
MSDHDTRALLAEVLEFLNDRPRFSLRRNRRRNSYDLAARIAAHLAPWDRPPHRAIAVARDRWASSGVLRVDADEHIVVREADGYWVRGWIRIAFSNIGEIDEIRGARYRKALDALPEITRAILLAHQQDERTYSEIARQFGLTITDVEARIAEALLQIDRALEHD